MPGVDGPAPASPVLNPRLWPFQQRHVTKALAALPKEGAFVFNNEMGLGKSPEALETLRCLGGVGRILILCPAMVREDWARKLDEWWPGHPEVEVVKDGKQAATAGAGGILLTSYGLVPKLPKLEFGATVFDELHYLQGDSAARTLVCQSLLRKQATPPLALGLTGTLISGQPLSMWKPLDVLFPGRFGTRNQFGARYCKADATGFGNAYYGVNPLYVDELAGRLHLFSARSTKLDPDVAPLLPPFLVQRAYTPRRDRESTAIQCVGDALANGARRVVVLTHLRDSAVSISNSLKKLHGDALYVSSVSGAQDPGARDKVLQELARTQVSQAVLVATMHSVGIGIDLTWAEEVILAELDYSPTQVLQALGRFSRLSGKRGVRVTVLLQEGRDPVGEALASKIQAAARIVSGGQAEAAASDFDVRSAPLSNEETDALLRGMLTVVEDE